MAGRYPENHPSVVKRWSARGLGFTIIKHVLIPPDKLAALRKENPGLYTQMRGWHYCGYARFEYVPLALKERKRDGDIHKRFLPTGIADYVPVHGGITYGDIDEEDGSAVYGFDCGHVGDDAPDSKTLDLEWVGHQCDVMAFGIEIASKCEEAYNKATSNEDRGRILDAYHKELESQKIKFDLQDNFGAMINVLSGKL
jgi:hypothetical protein